ncbi:luciferase family protein [Actinobacteria bacterium OK074]|nr:luciferase family protein [Actinobacteria bacterium OK074]
MSPAPGRIELVAGRGSSTITFPLFDHDEHDMLYASQLAPLMAVNADENVTWYGPHRKRPLRDAAVFPRPEEPLKIWLGTGGSPDSVGRAVESGLPMFLGVLGGTPEHRARYGHAYRDAWAQAGHPADPILHLHELLGHTRQILQMDVGGMPRRDFLRAIELLGMKVLPQIRAEAAKP